LRLLAVPNVSEGRGRTTDDAVSAIVAAGGRLLDVHADPDHNRAVYTVTGEDVVEPLLALGALAVERIDLRSEPGLHPHVGVLDVAPVVYLDDAERGAACAAALVLGDRLGHELGLPVLLYGELAGGRTRAELRRGGPAALAQRIAAGQLRPDFGPAEVNPSTGVTLVAARPPLVAFNVALRAPATVEVAREIAAAIRESGSSGLSGVRAIGLWLAHRGLAQVSMNLEDYRRAGPAAVVAAIAARAPVAEAELVGLAPRAAFAGFPEHVPVRNLRLLEDHL
jgi:glutamate formiminotransferase/glutamate formiminotransferase/formiminotetrahydrofolate cyclodeaminase